MSTQNNTDDVEQTIEHGGYGNAGGKPPETIGLTRDGDKWRRWDEYSVDLTTVEENAIKRTIPTVLGMLIDAKNGESNRMYWDKCRYIRLAQALRQFSDREGQIRMCSRTIE